MKPTNQDKLYALSVAAGKATKDGNVEELLRIGNAIASLATEEDIDKAKSLLDELQKLEPEGIKCENHISSYHMELGGKFAEEDVCDISHMPHDQALYCLVCSLGGNLRALASSQNDKKASDTAAKNINLLLNMIAKAVTKEDWDKAIDLIDGAKKEEDEDDDDSTDAFRDFLSA